MLNLMNKIIAFKGTWRFWYITNLKEEQIEREKQREKEKQERRLVQAKLGQRLERDEKLPRRHRWPCECRACRQKNK